VLISRAVVAGFGSGSEHWRVLKAFVFSYHKQFLFLKHHFNLDAWQADSEPYKVNSMHE
jgi:hypothetical protein